MPESQAPADIGEKTRSPSTGSGDFFSSIASQIVSGDRQLKADTSRRQKEMEGMITGADQEIERLQGDIGNLEKSFAKELDYVQSNKPPQAKVRSPLEAFGQAAAVIGALGGLLTRRPLTTGLNAATAAITAARQSDWDTYKIELENWQTNTDHALKVFGLQNQQLKSIIDSERLTVDQKLQKARMLGELNHDAVQVQAAQTGDLLSLAQLANTREAMGERISEHKFKMEEEALKMKAWGDIEQSDEYKNAGPRERSRMLNEFWTPGVAAAAERGRTAGLKQQQAQQGKQDELTAIASQIDSIEEILTKASDVAGAKGTLENWWNVTAGQVLPGFPNRREFEAKMKMLQTMLQNKYLNSRYFSKSALSRMEELVPGLEALEGPQDAITHLEELKKVIKGQVQGGLPEETSEASGMSDADLKKALGIP